MRTLIKNGTVVTATDQYKGDILVEGETISVIGTASTHADKVIDAASKCVLPALDITLTSICRLAAPPG
jgi:dihydropyrimidinase